MKRMGARSSYSVLVADDDSDTQEIFRTFLLKLKYMPYIVPDGWAALDVAKHNALDIAFVDVRMDGPSGLSLMNKLLSYYPEIAIVLITAYGSTEFAVEAMHQGAFYYLEKPISIKYIELVLDKIKKRKTFCDSLEQDPAGLMCSRLDNLTSREYEVLGLIAEGFSNKNIAQALSVSEYTVNNHVHHLLEKLNVKNRVQAATLLAKRNQN